MNDTARPIPALVVHVVALAVVLALLPVPQALGEGSARRLTANQAATTPGPTTATIGRNRLGMRFVQIPAGSFDMGSVIGPGEAPVHRVSVPSFWMGVTEVTQAQWQAVMGSNPSHFKQAGPDAPVEMVSWDDVQVFVARLNALESDRHYRLPSEAEWEYACRGGSTQDPYGLPTEVGWVKENSGGTTHPVGLKRPNGYGLYDMLGNVAEWTQDTWHPDYNGAPTDGRAWTTGGGPQHTLRGPGWDLPAFFTRCALRGPYDPIHRLGFRLVCVPKTRTVRRDPPVTSPIAAHRNRQGAADLAPRTPCG